jgi:hypothetical protein
MRFKEDNLQMQVAKYLDLLGLFWCHVGNERRTTPQAGRRLKAKGVKSGVPDCLIFTPSEHFKGLALELKIKPNKPTANQKKWLKTLELFGWCVGVAYDFDEAKEIIDKYVENIR